MNYKLLVIGLFEMLNLSEGKTGVHLMSVGIKWLVGLVLFLLLGWVGIYSGISDQWPGGGGADLAQSKLQTAAEQALRAGDANGFRVEVRGQSAFVSGTVTSVEEQAKVQGLVLASQGKGGLMMGGITKVDVAGIEVIAPILNPVWNVTRNETGSLVLSGHIADEAQRALLIAEAEKLHQGQVVDEMQLAPGAFVGAGPKMIEVVKRLASLKSGSIQLRDGVFLLSGTANSKVEAQQIERQMQTIDGAYTGSADLSYPPPPPNEFGVSVETGRIDDADECRALFAEALSKNTILFASSKAGIGISSHGFLNFLAELAGQCDAFSIKVEGHSDNTGERGFNVYLSGQRAKAVSAYLVSRGVDVSRLSSAGFGPDRPICSERTSDCRARNRRIEMQIEQ